MPLSDREHAEGFLAVRRPAIGKDFFLSLSVDPTAFPGEGRPSTELN